uniref:Bactericidal permeability-increasing protein n=1 Tax=Anser brachyrhynchus TaxID=132585 RepID=A0A8B9CSU9_9AVES
MQAAPGSRSPSAPCLAVTAKIDTTVGIDYSLTAPPVATAQFLNADLKGECFSLAQHTAIPFTPPALAFPPDHSRMVYFGVSSYFFNTASFAYHTAGALVFEITDSMIPKDIEFRLNTSTFAAFLPQVSPSPMYPNMPMKLRLSTPSAPFLSIGPDGVSLQPVVDIQAYAIYPNGSLAPLFLVSLVSWGPGLPWCPVSAACTSVSKGGRSGLLLCTAPCSLLLLVPTQPCVFSFPERLGKGFPLPLPAQVQLSDLLVQFHEVSGGSGACPATRPREAGVRRGAPRRGMKQISCTAVAQAGLRSADFKTGA